MRPLGIFGGMFDPIHYGHLRAAFELGVILDLEKVLFVPAADPPHRDRPLADAASRLAMVRAAIADEPRFAVDDQEVRRGGRSYTVLTLEALRKEHGQRPLVLMLGADALAGLAGWYRWRELPALVHLAIANRPGVRLPVEGELGAMLGARRERDLRRFATEPAGRVYVHDGVGLDVSSTDAREALCAGRDPRYLMPEPVRRMILDKGIYARPGATEG